MNHVRYAIPEEISFVSDSRVITTEPKMRSRRKARFTSRVARRTFENSKMRSKKRGSKVCEIK